jgi:predicted phosphodiesterase
MKEKHIFLSDLQIPDQNEKALEAMYKFILDHKPDFIHLVGDIVSFDGASSYTPDPRAQMSLEGEIELTKKFLDHLCRLARKANPNVIIIWYDGNHEFRLIKYLFKNASALANIKDEDDYIISIPHIFELKKRGIKHINYEAESTYKGLCIEHGDTVRQKSGYTAHAMLMKRQRSGISGHTHRLAHIMETHSGKESFWIENGCMCNYTFRSPYTKYADWQNGFSIDFRTANADL